MSNSVRPHRRQPTRLARPWDSPGKNTGVGCHFLLQCMKVKSESRSVVSNSLQPRGLSPARLLCPWDSPGKNTGVGCHFLLQGIFPTQESNPGLLHYRQTLYHLSQQGSPSMYVYMYIYIKNTIIENINIPLKKESTIFLKVHTGNIFVFMGHTIYTLSQICLCSMEKV